MKKVLLFISKYLLAAFFVGTIFAAFFASFVMDEDELDENRRMAEFPTQIDLKFPAKYEAYYLDNFPNRKKLIKRYNKTRFKKFGINNYLLFGDQNWLFFNSKTKEETDSVADFLGTNRYSDKLLSENIDHLVKEIGHMKKFGAEVYVMIVPNKATVYPELMPVDYKNRQAEESKADQIIKALKTRGIKVIETKEALLNAKEKAVVYRRTDTHWNNFGAFVAYKEIEKALRRDKVAGIRPLEVVQMSKVTQACGDLQRYLFDMDNCLDENWELTYNRSLDAECLNTGKGNLPLNAEETTCTVPAKSGKKMLMIRDSFAEAFMPMLSSQFRESVYMWRTFVDDDEIRRRIKEEKPDIIILEYLERFVGYIGSNIFE